MRVDQVIKNYLVHFYSDFVVNSEIDINEGISSRAQALVYVVILCVHALIIY